MVGHVVLDRPVDVVLLEVTLGHPGAVVLAGQHALADVALVAAGREALVLAHEVLLLDGPLAAVGPRSAVLRFGAVDFAAARDEIFVELCADVALGGVVGVSFELLC